MNRDPQKTLDWCVEHEVTFKLTKTADQLVVTARCDNIAAEYFVDQPYTEYTIGRAIQAALFAVKEGSEFHSKFGHFPPTIPSRRDGPTGDGTDKAGD